MRIGNGYDVHRLVENRKLVLGGVEIEYDKGLAGHSDADVLVHAVMDALLGAMAIGDIGKLFPDTDNKYKDANSIKLLEYVRGVMSQKGYKLVNIDTIIAAQKPKLSPHIFDMRKNIAAALETDVESISVKATTTEKLGFEGRGEGISAYAVCLIEKI